MLKSLLFVLFLCEVVFAGAFFAAYVSFAVLNPPHKHVSVLHVRHERPVRVLFAGDIMLDRDVARNMARVGENSFVQGVLPLFAGNDINVANLEGTVTNYPSIAQASSSILRFTFAPALVQNVLALLKLDVVSLANNHALDFGVSGYTQTRNFLAGQGVLYFGSPSNSENLSIQKLIRGKTICFVGYQDFITPDPAILVQEIAAIGPACYRTVVFAHWGQEYQVVEDERQRNLAHTFVDAGADLVIGAHPHVIEPTEVYKGKVIFYSLGNFIFDQYFSVNTKVGLAVKADFYDTRTDFTLARVSIERDGISIVPGPEETFSVPR